MSIKERDLWLKEMLLLFMEAVKGFTPLSLEISMRVVPSLPMVTPISGTFNSVLHNSRIHLHVCLHICVYNDEISWVCGPSYFYFSGFE